ncbi:sucrase ferredoxin [Salipiger sp. IMCC34102]|uniref:sucrase ferredoxin n=1 Tax=Salipiger sp. IMCC34102 TaxID=2510647 RepID=UPI0013EC5A4C|nr:sucrase ferredoxin [Salipiger sp. IMCC34102]
MTRPERITAPNPATGHPKDLRFCTAQSLAAGEPLAGTGVHPEKTILIQWPKARWRHSLKIAEDMDPDITAAIEALSAAGWRVNLIDRKGEYRDTIRVFIYPEALAFDLAPRALANFLVSLPEGAAALDDFGPTPADTPVVLCCTHGKHDRCCAKWGFAVYKALAAEAEARGDFDVWEVTHLGGCRLSAGVLVLPALRKYGRLRPADAPDLLDAEARDTPYLPCYRGASHLDQAEQVAEVAALQHFAKAGIRGPARVRKTQERTYAVTVGTAIARVLLQPDEVTTPGTCADLDAARPIAPKTVWRAQVDAALADDGPAPSCPPNPNPNEERP